jgi:hypothetical protein
MTDKNHALKSNDVHRSVRSQRFARSAGDAPNIGRVSRVPGTGLPKGLRRRRRRDAANPQQRRRRISLLAWSLLLLMLALSVLAFFMVFWLRGQMGRKADAEDLAAARAIQRHKVSEFPSPSEQDALDRVKDALALRDPAEVANYFRLGQTPPAAVVSFLEGMQELDGRITGYQWLSSMDANHLLLDGVLVVTSKDGAPRNRIALLTPDQRGVWKIDFDAFARTVRPSWEELLAEDGGKGLVRVILAGDSYFNGPFKDDGKWHCYGMASPDSEKILLGYCRQDSPQARALSLVFHQQVEDADHGSSRLKRATLELERPQGAEPRQFEITRVLAEDWVLSDTPFDETGVKAGSPGLPPEGGFK